MSTQLRSIIIIMAAMICLLSMTVLAEEANEVKEVFVDFDGDGFNDNHADANENGIPDRVENRTAEAADATAPMASVLGNVFEQADPNAAEALDKVTSNYDKFCAMQFKTRAISLHRGGFNAGEAFGPGNGIGVGSVSSGCEGGVCHF